MGDIPGAEAQFDSAVCKAELEAVLASRSFKRAPAVSKILAYVCKKHLEGAAGGVSEWSIAVDGLGRKTTFDPERDSIVRVEFHLLRKRLSQFYANEGSSHAVRIVFSESGYVPRFVPAAAAPDAQPATAAAGLGADDAVRIVVGPTGPKYVDGSGHSWFGDRYGTGGTPFDRSDRKIFRTLDQDVYQKGREGEFRYDIPVKPGTYELRLHFAETRFGQTPLEGGEATRRFDVFLNGRPILEDFDITRDVAGTNTATVKIWDSVQPGPDGYVRLVFSGNTGRPLLNGIELLPGVTGNPLPVRIVCGIHPVYDRQGRFWQPDGYFLGGRQAERRTVYDGTDDLSLYASARFGNFNYAIPVVSGRTYTATMRFAEGLFHSPGERLFDIFSNGTRLVTNFDILQRAGGPNRALEVSFGGLRPNPQDKLIFHFVPSRDYATLYAIEVEPEPNP